MNQILWGIGGMLTVVALAVLLSTNRRLINWRTVGVGISLQLFFAFLVFQTSGGRAVLDAMSTGISTLIDYTTEGISFLYGPLIDHEGMGTMFAFQVLPTVIFFSSLIAVLYHLGVMQVVIKWIGGMLSKLLGTTKVESINAAGNIFVGQTEAPLLIRPFISFMSKSELFAVMTGGFTSIAGSTLVGYTLLGIRADYLLAASFMAAPAALVLAKIIVPETEDRVETAEIVEPEDDDSANVFDAIANGATAGLKLVLNIGAILLSFIAILALMNGIIGYVGGFFGISITIEKLLGYLFAPMAFVIGVPWEEAVRSASFIGQKLVANEFVAFTSLGEVKEQLSEKAEIVTTFALTGFGSLSGIGVQIGALGGLAPDRRKDVARLGLRAVVAATLANFLSASIAGMFL
ncbi:NupC/NupG family nucleoside CNT transporter [Halobacillus sp. ACCC02827]|uniref:NupC/NupG family nucleoside CNT transporter n=1 Tax=unclassified Halobacillus TaxID=2636472 RepID=UPI0002A4DFD5|nr:MULTISPECIES: NupC/NupG family nucleoside CNT transporter [unclassified Halobacillus]ELK44922.1 nucleoside transporter YutK [Halobacillus sp. BAB-2008]WJE14273.1 NupC/NupG family nucleoside CNT transporter [Halobacillus sp. ACCC02827]